VIETNFHSRAVHFDTIKVFICQLMHKRDALKEYSNLH